VKKAQMSIEMLVSFAAMLLAVSIMLSSFPKTFNTTSVKFSEKQQREELSSALHLYYLTGGQVSEEGKCIKGLNLTVFNEEVNSFLCSVKTRRRWFLK